MTQRSVAPNSVVRQYDIFPSEFATFNTRVWQCHNTPFTRKNVGRTVVIRIPTPTPTPKPPVYTGEILNRETDLSLNAVYGMRSGIQFQRVDHIGIGIQSIIDLGILDAIDVWGHAGGSYEVCFLQSGFIIFLDAALMPRRPEPGEAYTKEGGWTCASYERVGTVALVSRLE